MARRFLMPDPGTPRSAPRSAAFLFAYALAYTGGVIGYLPLLTTLLPIRVDAIAGADRMGVLTATIVAGAVAASVANIAFGWTSDRWLTRGGGRRRWLAGGIAATALSYAVLATVASPGGLVAAVVLFQIAINALLAPLLAIMADEVPDTQKGIAGGLLTMASPLGATLCAVLVALPLGETMRLAILPLVVAACTIPLVLTRAIPVVHDAVPAAVKRPDLLIAWGARLLVQVAGSAVSAYLFYYLESIAPTVTSATIATRMGSVMIVAYTMPIPVAVVVGRLADRTGRTKPFLFAATAVAATGLVGMALAQGFAGGAVAFCVYTMGASVFLALHASFAMQLLPSAAHRGRDLGLLNLTNTLPALLGPALTWALATPSDFDAVMLVLAGLTLSGGIVILKARGRR